MRSTGAPGRSRSAPRIALAALALLTLATAADCRRPRSHRETSRSGATTALPPDRTFPANHSVTVWEIPVRHELVLPQATTVGVEPPAVRLLREQIAQRTPLESRLLLHPDRVVWELPEQAVPGGAAEPLYLVLKAKSKVAVLVSHKRKRYRAGPPARLAAWIEGTLRAMPPLQRLEVLGRKDLPPTADGQPPRRELRALAVLRGKQARPQPQEIRLQLRVHSEASPPNLQAQAALVWDVLLLPLLGATSLPVLEPLRTGGHWPRSLEISSTQEMGGDGSGPTLRITLDLAARRTRLVPARWLRLPPGRYQQEFGPLLYRPAHRLLHRDTRGLRAKAPGKRRDGPVALRNPGRRTLFVYGDGLLLGWVGPRGEARWKVLPPGYYRMAAHSLFGMTLWGPRDLYLPGPVTLRTP